MRYSTLLFVFLAASMALGADLPPGMDKSKGDVVKPSAPEDGELLYARRTIAEVYGLKIRKARKVPEKSALAAELLELSKTSKDLKEKYALLEQARELAVEAKDLGLATQALDLIAETWKVDKEPLKKQLIADLAGHNDETTKILKKMDGLEQLAKSHPEKLGAIADSYYSLIKATRGQLKKTAEERAVKYYTAAMPKLSGLEKMKAEGRVKELTAKNNNLSKEDADLLYLAGKWKLWPVGSKRAAGWTIYQNGTTKHSGGATGTWVPAKEGIVIKWSTGAIDIMRRPIDPRGTILDTPKKIAAGVLRKQN